MRDRLLRRLAVRIIGTQPRLLLATILAEHDDATLAARLGCELSAMPRLRLCPALRPEQWDADTVAIATGVGCNPERLGGTGATRRERP
jgi:hypothetical protein